MLSWLKHSLVRSHPPAPVVAQAAHAEPAPWDFQAPRHVPADIHVSALVTLAYDAGVRGTVRPKEILRYYGETCNYHSFVPLCDQQLLVELGARLVKTRPRVHTANGMRQLTHYRLPDEPGNDNLKLIRKSKTSPRKHRRGSRRKRSTEKRRAA